MSDLITENSLMIISGGSYVKPLINKIILIKIAQKRL